MASIRNYILSGITELLVLFFLSKRDGYIYEIAQAVSTYSEGKIVLGQNTIYAVAYKLEREGKISEYTKLIGRKRTRVYYHLEEKGKSYMEEQFNVFHDVYNGANLLFSNLSNGWEEQ